MPTYEVTSPEGKKFHVTAPEGASQDQVLAYAQANFKAQQPQSAPVDSYTATAKSDSNTANLLASIGGAMKAPYLGAKQLLGQADPAEIDEYKKSMAGLWSTPMGKAGTVAGGLAAGAPIMAIPGANTLAGAMLGGTAIGAMQPVGDGESRLMNSAVGGVGGMAGQAIGGAIASRIAKSTAEKAAELTSAKAANATRDATVREAQQAGYVIPPTQANPSAPGAANRLLEGLSGKIQTAQAAAIKNQRVTDSLAKKSLGLPNDVPITPENLKAVRGVAGEAYKQLKTFGPINADEAFAADLGNVAGEYTSLAKNFPSQKNGAIDSLLEDLNKTEFHSSDAVELVKRLRHDGFKNIGAQDPAVAALGKVQIGAQNAIEDLLDRNLVASGNADFLPVFRNARQLIAKSYTVEKALEEGSGRVIASKIGREFSKGKPLTDELATIGKTAQVFPKAVQNVNTSMPGLSPLDFGAGLLTGAATGNPATMALPLARPLARSAILSQPYQRAMVGQPNYDMSALRKALPNMSKSDIARMLERTAGSYGLLGIAPEQ